MAAARSAAEYGVFAPTTRMSLCEGTPEQICNEPRSHTARFLKIELGII